MKVELSELISSVHGNLGDYYFKHFNGKTILARRPHSSTPKQQEVRMQFAIKYGNRCKKIKENEHTVQ